MSTFCRLGRIKWGIWFLLIAIGVNFGLAGFASASDLRGSYSVRGIGTISCSKVVKIATADSPQLIALVAWSDGLLTATNRLKKGVFDALPFNEPAGLLTNLAVNLCSSNPTMIYDTAVETVLGILDPVALRASDAPVVASVGNESVNVRSETIRSAQAKLIRLKLMKGSATGVFDTRTSEALKKFQLEKKLNPNGLPDAATVFALILK